jgi:hypothetical protein
MMIIGSARRPVFSLVSPVLTRPPYPLSRSTPTPTSSSEIDAAAKEEAAS